MRCKNGRHVGRRVFILQFGGGYICDDCGRDLAVRLITCDCGLQEYRATPIPHIHLEGKKNGTNE